MSRRAVILAASVLAAGLAVSVLVWVALPSSSTRRPTVRAALCERGRPKDGQLNPRIYITPTAKPVPTAMQLAKRLERKSICREPKPVKQSHVDVVRCKAWDQSGVPYIVMAFPSEAVKDRKVRSTQRFSCRTDPTLPLEHVGGPTWVVVGVSNEYGVAELLHGDVVKGKCPKSGAIT